MSQPYHLAHPRHHSATTECYCMDQGSSGSVSHFQVMASTSASVQNQSLRTRLDLVSLQESLQEPMVLSPAKDISPFTFSFDGLSPLTFNPQIKSTSSVSSDITSAPVVGLQPHQTASVVPSPMEHQQQQQHQQQGGRVSKPRRRSHRRQRRRRRVTTAS